MSGGVQAILSSQVRHAQGILHTGDTLEMPTLPRLAKLKWVCTLIVKECIQRLHKVIEHTVHGPWMCAYNGTGWVSVGVGGPRLDYDCVRDCGLARRNEEEAPQWIADCFTKNDNGRVTNAYPLPVPRQPP